MDRETAWGLGPQARREQCSSPHEHTMQKELEASRWAFVNCQGVSNKVEELEDMLHREKFGILGLAETWLRAGQSLEMERYSWFGVEREGTGTRGE